VLLQHLVWSLSVSGCAMHRLRADSVRSQPVHCTPHSTQYTHYRLKHILPLHSNDFNDVLLLIISTKTVTLASFHRMLHDDGPNGPKYVGAI
jgi:hypothetical protein